MKPILFNTEMIQAILAGNKTQTRRVVPNDVYLGFDHESTYMARYQPGDILWVRETWAFVDGHDYQTRDFYLYKATDKEAADNIGIDRWRPSIHMPREAARILLRVTNVKVERVQDISEKGAQAEGVEKLPNGALCGTYRRGFEVLWDKLYGNLKGGIDSWDENPFVWVYEFERLSKDEAEKDVV